MMMTITIDHWIEMSHLLQMYKIRLDFITLSLGLRFLSVCSVCIMYMVWAGKRMHPPIPSGSVLGLFNYSSNRFIQQFVQLSGR